MNRFYVGRVRATGQLCVVDLLEQRYLPRTTPVAAHITVGWLHEGRYTPADWLFEWVYIPSD